MLSVLPLPLDDCKKEPVRDVTGVMVDILVTATLLRNTSEVDKVLSDDVCPPGGGVPV